MSRTYPYKAWTLQPSFKPVEVELTDLNYKGYDREFDQTEKCKAYDLRNLFTSKEAAVTEGWARIEKQEADILKRQTAIDKRKDALCKAERK